MKCHNVGKWMPYRGYLLVAVFVKILSCLVNNIFVLILMLTRPLLNFVSLHIGSNYLCTNLELGGLARSLKMEAIFLVIAS